ncbi:FadR/GntR family transcriptional regulator [Allopusillimonas ginsengisoli]|uniref:FadR/GntR family transcriptional regulator n=1 Tax=Allopusillimonas ginsengisoli TaxID=453575 RepID=UPI00101FDF2C|nr:FadR/GntR family transcriptional regulator [Allopusillimonas ginsengisoli]TEA78762.1 FadR family transcriptional regulator [Allopusillimonas ginsengisoli]
MKKTIPFPLDDEKYNSGFGPKTCRPDNHRTSYLRSSGIGKVTERVVHEIRAYIESNNLQPGDRLPPERYFIEQLKVSRSSLREAMRVLTTLGLVEVRHGDGTYVAAATATWRASSVAIFDATEENALRNLVETRVGIEIAVVNAVVQRASEEDFDRLEQLLDQQAEEMTKNPSYAWEPLEFELALIEITGNTWLYEVELMLQDAWRSLSGGLKASVGRYAEWHSEHRAILASLRSRNVTQAQRLVMAHVSFDRFEADLQAPRTRSAKDRPSRD